MTPPAPTQTVVTPYTHEAAYDSGHLKVRSIHEVYYAQYSKKDGLPVIYLHGGPGGNTSPANAKFFDPAVYRVVLMDQRGVGQSRPRNELRENTTHHLSDDIKRLREHLGIAKWRMVFGGSWGSTPGLFYAQAHPESVGSLVLRGVLAARKSELLVDREVAVAAAREWNRWDLPVGTLRPDVEAGEQPEDPEWCLTHALFECHYLFQNAAWMEDGQILFPANIEEIKDIPGAIVRGRYDLVCPPVTAWEAHKAWPKSSLHWVDDAGHSATEPGTTAKLIQVCDELAKL